MAAVKFVTWLLALVWVPLLFIDPLLSWSQGTARDVRVEMIAAPYRDAPALVYQWSGDVIRACPIRLDRQIVDAAGYVHNLVPANLPAPDAAPGPTRLILTVETPASLPDGPAIYQVWETPACNWLQHWWGPRIAYPPLKFTVTN